MKEKPKCETLLPWLRANLGNKCLAPLTGTDARALAAAVQIVELYAYHPDPELLKAFGTVVKQMQRKTWHLAFHAVAHVMDWNYRDVVWWGCGLEPIVAGKCAYEPGGEVRAAA